MNQRGIRQRKVWAGLHNNGIDLYGMGDHFRAGRRPALNI